MIPGKVLGVTGGIASGKSLVTAMLADMGCPVLSADQVARDVVEPGTELLAQLVASFGSQILTPSGSLDRDQLGKIIFNNSEARQQLNALMHPAIAVESAARLAELRRSDSSLIVYEAPLLFEANAVSRVDEVLVVFVAPETQVERLCARDGIEREAALAKIAAQWHQSDKLARADYVIDNSGPIDETQAQVEALYHYLTADRATL